MSPTTSQPAAAPSSTSPSISAEQRTRANAYLAQKRPSPALRTSSLPNIPKTKYAPSLRYAASRLHISTTPTVITSSSPSAEPESPTYDEDNRPEVMPRQEIEVKQIMELHHAASGITQFKTGSPSASPPRKPSITDDNTPGISPKKVTTAHRAVNRNGLGHNKSSSAPEFRLEMPASNDVAVMSDFEDDRSDSYPAPKMLRKKSGELVRPSLKIGGTPRRRPQSMPSTPNYSKSVHFDSKLEHVRHFLKAEKPAAVSASTSPTAEEPPNLQALDRASADLGQAQDGPIQYSISTPQFPPNTADRKALPVHVESVDLSPDRKTLVGKVAVQNLAFHKWVAVRFTVDNWQTTSEVAAEYLGDAAARAEDGQDRFKFVIRLHDLANLENKTMLFCVRYNVEGHEFWDNNSGRNFSVEFRRRPQFSLPRRASYPHSRPTFSQPKFAHSQNAADSDDEGHYGHHHKGEDDDDTPHFVLKAGGPGKILDSVLKVDTTQKQQFEKDRAETASPGVAAVRRDRDGVFSSRYDFSASLTQAIKAASSALGSSAGFRPRGPIASPEQSAINPYFLPPVPALMSPTEDRSDEDERTITAVAAMPASLVEQAEAQTATDFLRPSTANARLGGDTSPVFRSNSPVLASPNADAGKPAINSTSYFDFINKYCWHSNGKVTSPNAVPSAAQIGQRLMSPELSPQSPQSPPESRSRSPNPPKQSPPLRVFASDDMYTTAPPRVFEVEQRNGDTDDVWADEWSGIAIGEFPRLAEAVRERTGDGDQGIEDEVEESEDGLEVVIDHDNKKENC
ncbi:hypothetical protein G7K_6532-t1 [Saitoella complicata NRRL Y-17804]|uniref:CBM21 domain-containing protein n=1 Tax=Saitoella complicata (strain BCRC 22490 / CBS 7301 / JCM 7358 / NBRC 10748 / NRRL Y-17804) TaxID=698492 RepID=A0A0E9NS08_SAICN|nr:hypothetical protein G7K_6532-t1 [Saitoella complicata NRRL Y-17804]